MKSLSIMMFKLRLILIFFLTVCAGFVKSQDKINPINFSIFPPISIVAYDSVSTTITSLGLIHNRESKISGLNLNLLTSETVHQMHGLSVNGLLSTNDGEVCGLLLSGFGNINKSESKGFLISGYFNLNFKTSKGFQFSGLSNFNIGKMTGVQYCGISNFVADTLIGCQIAAGFNVCASEIKGFQLGGLMNISMENIQGAQVSFTNYAKSVSGVQIGLVNASGKPVKGIQIGLFNYTNERSHAKIGFVNVCKETKLQLLTYVSGYTTNNSAARFKTNHTYSILGISLPSLIKPNQYMGIVHYRQGLIYPIKSVSVSGDVGYSHYFGSTRKIYSDIPSHLHALAIRLSFEVKILPKLSFFCSEGYEKQFKTSQYRLYKSQPFTEVGLILF